MIMTFIFFKSIGDTQKARAIVLLHQLILFVPAMLILLHLFESFAVWWAEPAV
jgi:MOP/MATE family multidrug-resistance efflux pump